MTEAIAFAGHHRFAVDDAALDAVHPIEPGKVRAKKLFTGDGVTVMSMAMDAGVVLKEHKAPVPILIQVLQGDAVIDVAGDRREAPAGTVVHIAAGILHEVEAVTRVRFLLMLLDRTPPQTAPAPLS